MSKAKSIREKGKLGLSKIFANIKPGDKVALIRNLSFSRSFPERYQGKTGVVMKAEGDALIVKIKDGNREKLFSAKKIHLKKLSS